MCGTCCLYSCIRLFYNSEFIPSSVRLNSALEKGGLACSVSAPGARGDLISVDIGKSCCGFGEGSLLGQC